MELSSDEHNSAHSNYCKFWNQRESNPQTNFNIEPHLERPLSLPSMERPNLSHEITLKTQNRTEAGSIPTHLQGSNTPEPGLRQVSEGQESCQAIDMSPLSQSCQSTAETEPDLMQWLDPIHGAEEPTKLPLYKQPALIPFQSSLFPRKFTQPSHYINQKYYRPPLPVNPFSPAYVSSQTSSYFHSPPLLAFGQASHNDGTQKSSAGITSPVTSSNSLLYDLLDSPAPASEAQLLSPTHIVGKVNDPFSDLLTIAKASTVVPTVSNKKVENLQRRWETFD